MKKSVELKQERTAKVEAQQAIVDKAKAENRDLSEAENTAFDALTEEIRGFAKTIERAEQVEANELLLANRNAAPVTTTIEDGEGKEKQKVFRNVSILKALRQATPGSGGLDGAEKEMHQIGLKETADAKVRDNDGAKVHLSIPLSYLGRATQQTVTQDSGTYGGALVQNQAPRIVQPLRPTLAVEGLGATFLTGLSGGNIPLVVGSDFTMAFLAEGAAITPHKKTFAGPTLSPKRAGGAVDISNQLLMQSSVDAEGMVMNGLKNGFAQLLHAAIINGAGGVAPTGLLSYSGVNAAADTVAKIPTWSRIVELQSLIEEDDATSEKLGYIIHPKIKGLLKQITKDAGSGRFLLENGAIDGLPFVSTSQIPVLDDGADPAIDTYPILFGDWSQMYIGQWGSVNVTVNPYSSDLSDSLRLVLNTHADMQIANPAAFSKNAFIGITEA